MYYLSSADGLTLQFTLAIKVNVTSVLYREQGLRNFKHFGTFFKMKKCSQYSFFFGNIRF